MNDASLPPYAPMTTANGTLTPGHGEVDASYSEHPPPTSLGGPPLEDVCADIHNRIESFLTADGDDVVKRTQEQTRIALGVVEKALRDYEFEQLSLSYNGGKDCLVLLVLYLSVLHTYLTSRTSSRKEAGQADLAGEDAHLADTTRYSYPPSRPQPLMNDFPTMIPSIYAKPPDPFTAVTSFVDSSSACYRLDLTHIITNPGPAPTPHQRSHSSPPPPSSPSHTRHDSDGTDKPIVTFRDAFAVYLEQNPRVKAIFVGTRRTDPHGSHLTHFDLTDGNWPRFMRIHPVIDWHLDEIWTFLRHPTLGEKDGSLLEYCSMYDEGYTSLGGRGDTVRNPKLKSEGGGWRPAYEMVEDQEERAGRE